MGEVHSKAGSPYFSGGAASAEDWGSIFSPSREPGTPSSDSDTSTTPSSQSSLRLEDGTLCETVIVFDWDDTLLCSTAINHQQWSPVQMAVLEQAVEGILATAMTLGETFIVTNGISSWVQDSASRFLPNLIPTLERLSVHSARAKYEKAYPGDPMTWKRQAFKDIFVSRRRQGCSPSKRLGGSPDASPSSVFSSGSSSNLNMVVLGDSPAEIEAARAAGRILGKPTLIKTVKLKEAPSVNELVGQLRRLHQDLVQVVQQEESMHRILVQRPGPASFDYLASWASGWKIHEERPVNSHVYGNIFGR
jgi:hypothetical protein